MVNAKEFDDQKKLESLLIKLGFIPEPVQGWRDYDGLTACLLRQKKNGFGGYGDVVVSVVRDAFDIDFFSEIHFVFLSWAVFRGDVSETELREKIFEAGSDLPLLRVCEEERYFWEKAQERKKKKEKSPDDTD